MLKNRIYILFFCAILLNNCSRYKLIKEGFDQVVDINKGTVTVEDTELIHYRDNSILLKGKIISEHGSFIDSNLFKVTFFDEDNKIVFDDNITPDNCRIIFDKSNSNNTVICKINENFELVKNRDKIKTFKIGSTEIIKKKEEVKIRDKKAIYTFIMTKPKVNEKLFYEDKSIKILFNITSEQINFQLNNKTEDLIEINWNKVTFVDFNSESQKIFHSNIKFIDKEKIMPETIIPPLAKINDFILPSVNSYYGEYSKSWVSNTLFPYLYKDSKELINKTFGVFFPLKINNITQNYYFTFQIKNISEK